MKKIIIFPFIVSILLMSSCASKNIKAEITPNDLVELYSSSQYKTFVDDYENNDSIKYDYSVKVYNSEEESRNYLFVYFFEDDNTANDFYKEYNSKTGFIWLFGLIFGEDLNVKYEKLNNGFKFIFIRNNVTNNVTNTVTNTDLTDIQIQILERIKVNNNIKVDDIASALDTSARTIQRGIKLLTEEGYIKRIGTKSGHWEVLK